MKLVKQWLKPHLLYLVIIIIMAAFLRFYNLNWDQGHHLHPDERAIVMFTIPLQLPKNLDEFLSPQSPWNPHFFAYGNFPLYLLKTTSSFLANLDPLYAVYEKINLVGRAISAIADIGTLILVYLLSKKLFNKKVALLAAFFYAISVFPIQTAHFFAVDTLLTFFITLTLYQLVRFYEKPSILNSVLVGFFFGLSLTTKVSAIPLLIAIFAAIAVDFALLVIKQPHKPNIWFPHVPRFLKRLIFDGVIISIATVITFAVLQPYAIIDFQEFIKQTQLQSQMTRDAFTFPYTLQYVGKTPYLYELKNIFLWGQGPILATLSFLGTVYITVSSIRIHLRGVPQAGRQTSQPRLTAAQHHLGGETKRHLEGGRLKRNESHDSFEVDARPRTMKQFSNGTIIILAFFWLYFLIVGNFAVAFMRYMLPLYPLLAIFAAFFVYHLLSFRASGASRGISYSRMLLNEIPPRARFARLVGMTTMIILILLWPLSFMHIYTQPNTRVLASQWIYQNIPPNSIIAREHWDDGLPIGGNTFYQTLELPIYDMQNSFIEPQIYQRIQQADYIIIASNRLYAPLQRISQNCQKWNLPPEKCSHNANRYYKKLFNGELGYKKVAEFSMFPHFSFFIFHFSFDDSSADESFIVYDHPKVMIFKNKQKEL